MGEVERGGWRNHLGFAVNEVNNCLTTIQLSPSKGSRSSGDGLLVGVDSRVVLCQVEAVAHFELQ